MAFNGETYGSHPDERAAYAKAYYAANKERLKEYRRKWNEENKEYRKEYSQRYQAEHKERIREWDKEYRKENKDHINEHRRKYNQSSPERFLAQKLHQLKKGRHRGKSSDKYQNEITLDYLIDLWVKQQGICALSKKMMCHHSNSPFTISIDRIDSNQAYVVGNVQLVCAAINFAKNKYSNEEFLFFWNNSEVRPSPPNPHP